MKSSFGTGLLTGAVIGAVAGMVLDPIKDKQSHKMHKSADGFFKSLGCMVDHLMTR